MVLVDNAPYSYMMQLDNGIPILNYLKGKFDDQLLHLEPYLMSLLEVDDVRVKNRDYFKLSEYTRFSSHEKLVKALYQKYVEN